MTPELELILYHRNIFEIKEEDANRGIGSLQEQVIEKLKVSNLYNSQLLYRFFDERQFELVKKTGTDRDPKSDIDFKYSNLDVKSEHLTYLYDETWFNRHRRRRTTERSKGVIVYDPKYVNHLILFGYEFIDEVKADKTEALVAIFHIID